VASPSRLHPAEHDHLAGAGVQEQLQAHVRTMQDHQDHVAVLGDVVEVFSKVTANYAPGLFYTYDVPNVPPTNNALEQCFGSVRWHERRATGRTTVPGFGRARPVRVLAAVVSHSQCLCVQALQLHNTQAWDHLRDQLEPDTNSIVCNFAFARSAGLSGYHRGYPHQGGFAALVFLLFDT